MGPTPEGAISPRSNLTTVRARRCPLTPHGSPVAAQDRRHVLQATLCSRIEGGARYCARPPTPERFWVVGAAPVSARLLHGVTGGGGLGWVSAQSLGPVAGPAPRVSTGREVPDDRHDPIHCPRHIPARIH